MAGSQIFDFAFSRFVLPLPPASSSSPSRGSASRVFTLKDKPWIAYTAATMLLATSIGVFTLYSPLAYGNTWTKSECRRVKLFDTWDWDCNTFLDTYAEYSLAVPSSGSGVAMATGEFLLDGVARWFRLEQSWSTFHLPSQSHFSPDTKLPRFPSGANLCKSTNLGRKHRPSRARPRTPGR